MVFWGIKLKPKRPFFLEPDQYEGGKLRVTNATPGKPSDKRSVIKCRVGDGPEICICAFKPGAVSTTQLELEFEEPVQFSLTGSAPVYLSGYFYDDEAHNEDESGDDEEADMDYDNLADFINDDEEDLGYDDDDEEEESDDELAPKTSSVKIVEIEEAQTQETGPKLLEAPADPMKVDEDVKQAAENAAENEKSEDEDGLPAAKANKRKITSSTEPSAKKSKNAAAASDDVATPESGKKKKKKQKKKQKEAAAAANGNAEESPEVKAEQKTESAKKTGKKASTIKKFPNGLEIQDLAMGKPDGKQAKAGKKVSVLYTGKLKSSGKIFDSNVGKRPFQFRLGINEVVKGFDVGVAGMRIGDKRRVTIPPAMGYGSKSVPGIPPNSWLVFDLELVDVKG